MKGEPKWLLILLIEDVYKRQDWGWFPDPFAFIRLHYDRARETIYLMDEIYQNKLTNEASGKLILSKGYKDAYITCDSAEPKSSADYRAMGLPAKDCLLYTSRLAWNTRAPILSAEEMEMLDEAT